MGIVYNTPMKKPFKITLIVIASVIALAGVLYLIPAPFKPSLWQYLNERSIQSRLGASSDPVYLPRTDRTASYAGITYHSRFTTYSTWKDAYYIQSINQGYYYQLSPRSVIEQDQSGPEPSLIAFLQQLRDGKICEVKDKQVTECSFVDGKLGERKFMLYGIDGYTLVTESTQVQYSFDGDKVRQPTADEVKLLQDMLSDAAPVPLQDVRSTRFEYNI